MDAIKVKAILCKRFNINWTEYGSLTVREQNVLIDLLADEAKEANQSSKPSRPGMERIT